MSSNTGLIIQNTGFREVILSFEVSLYAILRIVSFRENLQKIFIRLDQVYSHIQLLNIAGFDEKHRTFGNWHFPVNSDPELTARV